MGTTDLRNLVLPPSYLKYGPSVELERALDGEMSSDAVALHHDHRKLC